MTQLIRGKYIIINGVSPILFSQGLQHVDVAAGRPVTSAGFFRVRATGTDEVEYQCGGYSESLNIASLITDANILRGLFGRRQFFFSYVVVDRIKVILAPHRGSHLITGFIPSSSTITSAGSMQLIPSPGGDFDTEIFPNELTGLFNPGRDRLIIPRVLQQEVPI